MGCVGGDEGGSGGGGGGGVIAVEEALEASEAQPVWQPMIGAMPYDVRWCLPVWRCSLLENFIFRNSTTMDNKSDTSNSSANKDIHYPIHALGFHPL